MANLWPSQKDRTSTMGAMSPKRWILQRRCHCRAPACTAFNLAKSNMQNIAIASTSVPFKYVPPSVALEMRLLLFSHLLTVPTQCLSPRVALIPPTIKSACGRSGNVLNTFMETLTSGSEAVLDHIFGLGLVHFEPPKSGCGCSGSIFCF